MLPLKYSYSHLVSNNEIDNLNHVNNVTYLQWVQNAAEKHWEKLSNKNINENFVWVVLRHEIDYMSPAFLNESITITTWIGKSHGVKSERFVEITRDNQLLAKAKTIWVLLHKKSLKPTRIPLEILKIMTP